MLGLHLCHTHYSLQLTVVEVFELTGNDHTTHPEEVKGCAHGREPISLVAENRISLMAEDQIYLLVGNQVFFMIENKISLMDKPNQFWKCCRVTVMCS